MPTDSEKSNVGVASKNSLTKSLESIGLPLSVRSRRRSPQNMSGAVQEF